MPYAFPTKYSFITEEYAPHQSRVALVQLGLVGLEDEVKGLGESAHHVLTLVTRYLLISGSGVAAILVLVHDLNAERH